MQTLEISDEKYPGDVRNGGQISATVRAQTLPSGDVEIVRCTRNTDQKLTVIPKSKRAALADFLVNAQ